MLRALAAAQEAIGFRHRDLRLANVMEHSARSVEHSGAVRDGATLATATPVESRGACGQEPLDNDRRSFKVIDYGHAQVDSKCVPVEDPCD